MAKKTTYRAILQPGHSVATLGKAPSQVMSITSARPYAYAWAVSYRRTWPAGKGYTVNGRGERFPYEYKAGDCIETHGGFSSKKELAERAAHLSMAPHTKGTKTFLWCEILPLEIVE